METINNEDLITIKKTTNTRQPKSEKTTNLQQIQNTQQQEPTIKAKTSKSKKTASAQPQDNTTRKPKARAKASIPRTMKLISSQMENKSGKETQQQQSKKILDTIVVDLC